MIALRWMRARYVVALVARDDPPGSKGPVYGALCKCWTRYGAEAVARELIGKGGHLRGEVMGEDEYRERVTRGL